MRNTNGSDKRRRIAAYHKGQRDALNTLEPIIRQVIEAIGLFATASALASIQNKDLVERLNAVSVDYGMPSRTTIDSAAVCQAVEAITKLEADCAGLRQVNQALCDLTEQLRLLARSRPEREALAGTIIQEAKAFEGQAA